jgi:hypothetical protein
LTYGSQRLSQLTGSIGLQARTTDTSTPWQPYGRVTYDYDLSHNERAVSIAGQTSVASFDGKAFLPARASFGLTGGVTARIARRVAVNVNACDWHPEPEACFGVGSHGRREAFLTVGPILGDTTLESSICDLVLI